MKNNIIPFYQSTDRVLTKSKDCYYYDSNGKRYIDFESGVWCTNIGHSNERIIKLIEQEIKESIHQGYTFRNSYAEELSDKLLTLCGFKEGSSVFLSSGSEAVNLSITMAQHFTGKKKILKINSSYLSAYGFGQIRNDNEYIINIDFDDIEGISKINFSEISALVLEVGGASMGVVQFPDKQFVEKLSEAVQSNGCLLIAEEVTTGIGRTGKWFGFQHYSISPDMVVCGKALGNGYPVSSVTINERLSKMFEKKPFRYAQSHQNDPLGCAIGLEVIKIIKDEDLITKSLATSQYFIEQLNSLREKHNEKIIEVRGRGMMLAVELNEDIDGEKIYYQLFDNGFVVGYKLNTFRFMPSLTITTKDIDKMVNMLDTLLQSI